MISVFVGHAGKDSGAIDGIDKSNGDNIHTIESNLTSVIATKLSVFYSLLGEKHQLVKGPFSERIAKSKGSSFGISIHANTSPHTNVNGFYIIHWPKSNGGIMLANAVDSGLYCYTHNRFRDPFPRDNLYILRETAFPTILVEYGFISNTAEEKLMNDEKYQWKIACGIFHGSLLYKYHLHNI